MFAMDLDCMRITRHGRSAHISFDVSGRHLVMAQDVSKVCEVLACVMSELRLDKIDFLQNAFGNTAIATLTTALLQ